MTKFYYVSEIVRTMASTITIKYANITQSVYTEHEENDPESVISSEFISLNSRS